MKIAFRADASLAIGTGHVMRCLTLADALQVRGAKCWFVCRPHEGHLAALIAQRGHQVLLLPALRSSTSSQPGVLSEDVSSHASWLGTDWQTDAHDSQQALEGLHVDWLVVDHYALDHRWEQMLRSHCQRLMVIDDLADRVHDADVLLDQNLGRTTDDYRGLLPTACHQWLGPQFALLRSEFASYRTLSLARRETPQLQHVLIAMGGVDKDNVTSRVLQTMAAMTLPSDLQVTVVMGPHAPWLTDVKAQAARMPYRTEVCVGVTDMARLMAQADWAIGAAGGTAWERCCLGLPSMVVVLANNQSAGAAALEKLGATLAVQEVSLLQSVWQDVMPTDLTSASPLFVEKMRRMSRAAAAVTDGLGCDRVVEQLMAK